MFYASFPLQYESYDGNYETQELRETVKSLNVGAFLTKGSKIIGVMHPDGSVLMFSTQNDRN